MRVTSRMINGLRIAIARLPWVKYICFCNDVNTNDFVVTNSVCSIQVAWNGFRSKFTLPFVHFMRNKSICDLKCVCVFVCYSASNHIQSNCLIRMHKMTVSVEEVAQICWFLTFTRHAPSSIRCLFHFISFVPYNFRWCK